METVKLFMVLLGSKGPGRTVEQHDFFFGIGHTLKELVPQMHQFWPEAGDTLHIDGWREITHVDGYAVSVIPADQPNTGNTKRLFFVNLGGYLTGKLEEQHYTLLMVQDDRKGAVKFSTTTQFFKQHSIAKVKGASAHIDEKYGIDVDEVYRIEDVLSAEDKARYRIALVPQADGVEDQINLGYYKLDKL
ncbi:DUF1543 domain-containing protein [Mucilaginibacter sp. RS28]|uniref:DUF1543 domain-containing protein n=1 Tax=Mucilaginibacter straminoryzae TaxID=2932774 RepID=A0A9X2BAM8_9SPHI|nr:DUF1543 domain-containing protein [Mucilaginibacter straminoryzae]MCJ8211576.1 DUF1543 domain-containing protein [Mucilaginibacter straminoryzae]